MNRLLSRRLAACACALVAATAQAAAPPHYDLARVVAPNGARTQATALGAGGHVTGIVYSKIDPTQSAGFLWTPTTFHAFSPFGSSTSWGQSVNAAGDVAGGLRTTASTTSAYIRLADGTMIAPFRGMGYESSGGEGINASRTITGYVVNTDHVTTDVSWHDGVTTPLQTAGYENNLQLAINDAGLVGGWVQVGPDPRTVQAATWTDGVLQLLPCLDVQGCQVSGVSSDNRLVGSSAIDDFNSHACLWRDGRVVDLGTLGQDWNSSAAGVNASGDVVGSSSQTAYSASVATIWRNGRIHDLSQFVDLPQGWKLLWASAINDAGQILATAGGPDGRAVDVVLTPRQ